MRLADIRSRGRGGRDLDPLLRRQRGGEQVGPVTVLHQGRRTEPPRRATRRRFEEAAGHVAWVFAAGAGWPTERRDRATGIIEAHMRGADPAIDPEGDLLDAATGLDIGGRGIERWPEPLLTEIVAAHPRLDLAVRFTACFGDQAARKPKSAAAASIRAGLAERLAANPLDQLA